MIRFSRIGRLAIVLATGLAVMALVSCSDYGGSLPKHMRPLDEKTRALVERKGMDLRSPILIRIFKEEAKLEVWKRQQSTGQYAFLKDYEICAWSGVLGPKIKEGDRQAPEGFYTIRPAQMKPDSNYYLAFNIGYPNDFDRSLGRTGSDLMVHGACSSRGCYSMTDENIQEIYTLGRLAFQGGQREFQVQAFPFRMTPENMAKHRDDPNMPFWLMLREGYDHFEAIGVPPKVDVCEHRYIFNSVPADGRSFNPSAACPPMSMPEPIRVAVADKEAKDDAKMLEIADRLDRREGRNAASALRLALATPSSVERAASLPMSVAGMISLEPTTTASVAARAPAETPDPATANDSTAIAAMLTATPAPASAVASAPAPTPRPQPASVASAPAAAPADAVQAAAVSTQFLPTPELRSGVDDTPAQTPAAAPAPAVASQAASLQERMLAGSAAPDSAVMNSYTDAQDDGLNGLVLKLVKKKQAEAAGATN